MAERVFRPGDLVFYIDEYPGAGYSTETCFIVSVKYSRIDDGHMGCEDRITVLRSRANAQAFTELCDCKLLSIEELS